MTGDRGDANEAGRFERRPGDPAYDVEGREAESMGLLGSPDLLTTGLRNGGVLYSGTLRGVTLDGLDSRETEARQSTITQLACSSVPNFSR